MIDEENTIIFVEKMFRLIKQITYINKPAIMGAKMQSMNRLLIYILEQKKQGLKNEKTDAWNRLVDN